MTRTPDRFPGTREETEVLFTGQASDPTDAGAARYVSGDFRMCDSAGVFNPRDDEKAKVSANDTTPGYLNGKLVAGAGVSLTENNDGSDETLTIKSGSGAPGAGEHYCCYTDSSHPYHEFGDDSYEAGGTVIFRGTNVGTPTAIKIVADSENAGKYWDFRIYDVTNGNTICEITNKTASVPTIFDMGTLSNLSSGEAVWELQGRKNATDGTSCQLYFVGVYY